jgi:hypothetical protein
MEGTDESPCVERDSDGGNVITGANVGGLLVTVTSGGLGPPRRPYVTSTGRRSSAALGFVDAPGSYRIDSGNYSQLFGSVPL